MGFEDDPIFGHGGARPDPAALKEGKRYHEMTDEERREAWERIRKVQDARAKRHHAAPLLLGFMSIASFVLGVVLTHYGANGPGYVAIWTAIGFTGFTIIAIVRNGMGSLAKRREDLGPPGL